MTPTHEFRWHKVDGAFKTTPVIKNAYDETFVLQHKWVEVRILSKGMTSIVRQEWRNVPLETGGV